MQNRKGRGFGGLLSRTAVHAVAGSSNKRGTVDMREESEKQIESGRGVFYLSGDGRRGDKPTTESVTASRSGKIGTVVYKSVIRFN